MGSTATDTIALFGDDNRTASNQRRGHRVYALAGLLQVIRAQRGWSVEQAAVQAGIGHMTWRRAEHGIASRMKTYTAIDGLLELPAGTVNRATRSDDLMVDLARHVGVDVSDVDHLGAAAWVEKYAEQSASDTPAGRVVGHREAPLAAANPDLPTALAMLAHHTPASAPTDLQAASELIERMRVHADHPEVAEAIQAVLRAIPAMIGVQVRQAERDIAGGTSA